MKRSDLLTILVVLLVVALTAAAAWYLQDGPGTEPGQRPAADAALGTTPTQSPFTTIAGDPVALASYRAQGKVVVANSWASWCPFCVEELPDFERLATQYREQDVVVLAINRKESAQAAQAYLDTVGGFDQVVFLLDPTDRFYASIGGITMPETIFYDTAGNVVMHKRGFMELAEMQAHVEAALTASQK